MRRGGSPPCHAASFCSGPPLPCRAKSGYTMRCQEIAAQSPMQTQLAKPARSFLGPMSKWKLFCLFAALLSPFFASAQAPTPSQAMALEQQGKLAEAAGAWQAITQHSPQDAAAFASWGVVLSKQGKYQEAVQAYEKALALNPKLPGIQLNLGLAEFKQGRLQEAIAPLGAALAADPQNMQAQTLLGLSYYGTKQFAEAAKYLKEAAQADPGNAELHQV